MRKAPRIFVLIAGVQYLMVGQSAKLDSPPKILNLGSNVSDGSITLTCTGEPPYSKLSCKVYRLWVGRPSTEHYRQSRAALQKDLASKSEEELLKLHRSRCSELPSTNSDLLKNLRGYSLGRAASAQNGYEQLKTMCSCTTKQCITSVMLEQQTHQQNECTVHSAVFSVDFVEVNDRKWGSNYGPEGICGVVSVFTIEHEAHSADLWTYTEQFTYMNNSEEGCKGLPGTDASTYGKPDRTFA
jgi:hypothetical protein